MRKIFCDGCDTELLEFGPQGFLRRPEDIFFRGKYFDGGEIEWCRKCTRIAQEAIKAASAG